MPAGGLVRENRRTQAGPRVIRRFIIALILLALVGGGLIGFNLFRDKMIAGFFANRPAQVLPVNTVTVAPVTWRPGIDAIGTVNAAQGVDLTVEAAGIVRELAFATNEKVTRGDLLLRLDDTTQLADLESAKTQLELAETALDRARALQRRGVAADASLEAAQANFRTAEAAVARAEVSLQTRRLVAPFDGTIGLPRIDPGAYITPGTVVATLQDLDRLRVDFSLPEQDLPDLSIGQAITLRLGEGPQEFGGQITGIDPRVDAASRMVQLRAEVQGAGGAMTPGQFVRITVALPVEDGVIALPQTAVVSSLYGDYVYVVRPVEPAPPAQESAPGDAPEAAPDAAGAAPDDAGDGPALELHQVFVTPGRRSGGAVEIRGDQIALGDQVVTSGQNRLSSGARVRIDNSVTPDGQGQTPPGPDADAATAPQEASQP